MAHWNSMPVKDRVQRFPTTRWSIVAAAQGPQTPDTREALERLCATYWYPAYAFIRGLTYPAVSSRDVYFFDENTGRTTRVLKSPGDRLHQFTMSPDGH